MDWSCEICGKDTANVDYDYLVGKNHLSCMLGIWGGEKTINKKKQMKIKGWDKINGFTYKGMCIVNPIHNADETKYTADVLNLNLPQKPKFELVVLVPGYKFKSINDNEFDVMVYGETNKHIKVSKEKIESLSAFRQLFESLVDELIK
jgi:hypothetical protein